MAYVPNTVTESALSGTDYHDNHNTLVFTSALIGYHFYIKSDSKAYYAKTTDGGLTWGGETAVSTDTVTHIELWYGAKTYITTPDNMIHLVYLDETNSQLHYKEFDPSDDSFGTEQDIVGSLTIAATDRIGLAQVDSGDLFAYYAKADAAIDVFQAASPYSSWSEIGDAGGDAAADWYIISQHPTVFDDILLVRWDVSESAIEYKIYDNSGDAWSASWTSMETNIQSPLSYAAWDYDYVKDASNSRRFVIAYVDNAGQSSGCGVYVGTFGVAWHSVVSLSGFGTSYIYDISLAGRKGESSWTGIMYDVFAITQDGGTEIWWVTNREGDGNELIYSSSVGVAGTGTWNTIRACLVPDGSVAFAAFDDTNDDIDMMHPYNMVYRDNDVQGYGVQGDGAIQWVNNLVGYVFILDNSRVYYKKTTDGGKTWGAKVEVTGSEKSPQLVSAWYEKDTAGFTSTGKIHVVFIASSANNGVYYFNIDVDTDTISSITTVDTTTITFGGYKWLSVTQTNDGKVYIVAEDTADETAVFVATSPYSSWSVITGHGHVATDTDRAYICQHPTNQDDILMISWDVSEEDLVYKVYDSSAGTWDESWSSIDTDAYDYSLSRNPIGIALDKENEILYLSYVNKANQAASGNAVKVQAFNGTSWTPKTSVYTWSSGNNEACISSKISVDNLTGDVYCVYVRDIDTADQKVFYKKSTDGGANWGSETQISAFNVKIEYMELNQASNKGARIAVKYFDDDATYGTPMTVATIYEGIAITEGSVDVTCDYEVVATHTEDVVGAYTLVDTYTIDVSAAYKVFDTFTEDVSSAYEVEFADTIDVLSDYKVVVVNTIDVTSAYEVVVTDTIDVTSAYDVEKQYTEDVTCAYEVEFTDTEDVSSEYKVVRSLQAPVVYTEIGIEGFEYAGEEADLWSRWQRLDDAASEWPELSRIDKKEGSYAVKFPWVYDTGTAKWTTSSLNVDISDATGVESGTPSQGKLCFWAKLPAAVTGMTVRIGSSSDNAMEYSASIVANGDWEYVEIDMTNGTLYGTPNWNTVTTLWFTITETATGYLRLDAIIAAVPDYGLDCEYKVVVANTEDVTTEYDVVATHTIDVTSDYETEKQYSIELPVTYRMFTTETLDVVGDYETEKQYTIDVLSAYSMYREGDTIDVVGAYKVFDTFDVDVECAYRVVVANTVDVTCAYEAKQFIDISCDYAVEKAYTLDLPVTYVVDQELQKHVVCDYEIVLVGTEDVTCAYAVVATHTEDVISAYRIYRLGDTIDVASQYEVWNQYSIDVTSGYRIFRLSDTIDLPVVYKVVTAQTEDITGDYKVVVANTIDVTSDYDVTRGIEITCAYEVEKQNTIDIESQYEVEKQNVIDIAAQYEIEISDTIDVATEYDVEKQYSIDVTSAYRIYRIGDTIDIAAEYKVFDTFTVDVVGDYDVTNYHTVDVPVIYQVEGEGQYHLLADYQVETDYSMDVTCAYEIVLTDTIDVTSDYDVTQWIDMVGAYEVEKQHSEDVTSEYKVVVAYTEDVSSEYKVFQTLDIDVTCAYAVEKQYSEDVDCDYEVEKQYTEDVTCAYKVVKAVMMEVVCAYKVIPEFTYVTVTCAYAVEKRNTIDISSMYSIKRPSWIRREKPEYMYPF